MSDLAERLEIKASVIEMGEQIAWGSDTALMREAAEAIRNYRTRVAELEDLWNLADSGINFRLSAALSDPTVGAYFKAEIEQWFDKFYLVAPKEEAARNGQPHGEGKENE